MIILLDGKTLLKDYEIEGFRGKSATTKRTYLNTINRFNDWLLETGTDLSNFTFVEVQQYIDSMVMTNVKATTINKKFNAIKHFCKFIKKPHIYEHVNVVKVSKNMMAPKALSRNERNSMLREANRRGPRDYAIICFLLYTGVRVIECSQLQIKHLFDIGEKSGFARILSKGNKERVVPLNAKLRQALAIYLKEIRGIDFYNKADMERHSEEPLFLSTHGKNVSVRRIQQLTEETGNTHPHALRHTFATVMLNELNETPTVVAQLMGHSSFVMLQRYTGATKEYILNSVDKFDT